MSDVRSYTVSRGNMSAAIEQFLKSMSILDDNEYANVLDIKFSKRTGNWFLTTEIRNDKQLELPLHEG